MRGMKMCIRDRDKDQTDKKGKYIRQERCAGACSRTFYVGEGVEPEDVTARFENGILQLSKMCIRDRSLCCAC